MISYSEFRVFLGYSFTGGPLTLTLSHEGRGKFCISPTYLPPPPEVKTAFAEEAV